MRLLEDPFNFSIINKQFYKSYFWVCVDGKILHNKTIDSYLISFNHGFTI